MLQGSRVVAHGAPVVPHGEVGVGPPEGGDGLVRDHAAGLLDPGIRLGPEGRGIDLDLGKALRRRVARGPPVCRFPFRTVRFFRNPQDVSESIFHRKLTGLRITHPLIPSRRGRGNEWAVSSKQPGAHHVRVRIHVQFFPCRAAQQCRARRRTKESTRGEMKEVCRAFRAGHAPADTMTS